jgi:hypothetical protein
VDPKKIESIKKVGEPMCKHDVQKLLGKINYLCQFIANLTRKVDSFLPLVHLKHENEFIWGIEQQEAFNRIKEYLAAPPVLHAPRIGKEFKLYMSAQENVIGYVLAQEDEGHKFIVMYLSKRLIDAETWYTPIEKLCLSLYYSCSKLCHYLLTSACIVVCQHDVIKYMLQRPILSARLGKWAYTLVEYDLRYETLKSMKGQVVVDFIVDHNVDVSVCMVEEGVWEIFFDGSVCNHGQGVGCFIMSPNGVEYEMSTHLEFECTNNQVKYEALLNCLETLISMSGQGGDIW